MTKIMAALDRPIHSSRQPFSLRRRLADQLLTRMLRVRANRHLRDGFPPMATFAFDFIGREISISGQFERDELTAIDDFLAPLHDLFGGATALDIGANIGNHSLHFARRFHHVHSFEPNPRTFGVLAVNAAMATNITVHNVALGNTPGRLRLTFDPLNVGEASLVATGSDTRRESCEVNVSRLDCLADNLGDVALMKIDVEGFELEVLRGAEATLREQMPIILFEQNRTAFENGRSSVASFLQDMGYLLCVLRKRHVSRGMLGKVANTLRKAASGTAYDIMTVNQLAPDNYAMIIAVSPADFSLLARKAL